MHGLHWEAHALVRLARLVARAYHSPARALQRAENRKKRTKEEKKGGIQALRFVLLHYTHDRDDNPLDALTLDARMQNHLHVPSDMGKTKLLGG